VHNSTVSFAVLRIGCCFKIKNLHQPMMQTVDRISSFKIFSSLILTAEKRRADFEFLTATESMIPDAVGVREKRMNRIFNRFGLSFHRCCFM